MEQSRWNSGRVGALIAGLSLYLCFWGLWETAPGLFIRFLPPFTNSNEGELSFWLGAAILLLPAGGLIGYGLSPFIWGAVQRAWRALSQMDSRQSRLGLVVLFILAVALARVGRALVLLDFPITDDEYAARFGGQVLAMGKVAVTAFDPLAAFPTRFLFLHDGKLSGFDWPGIQVAWALAEWTRSGTWLFALVAAFPVTFLAASAGRRLGRPWGAVAAAVALLSPMICALSFTSHAHLLSRGLLAFALWCYVTAEARSKPGWWAATGFGVGAAFFCRPFEIACLTSPLILALLVRALRRESGAARAWWAFAAGAAGPLIAFALFNLALTGNPFFPARFAPNPLLREPWLGALAGFSNPALLWHRFGSNTSYNLLMLAIWFGGPLGAALAALGIPFDRFTRLLGWGLLCNLGLGLLHDNSGIHLVGPIHYSEAAVPLTLLAVHGIVCLRRWCEQKDIGLRMVSSLLCGAAVLSLGTFIFWQSLALRRQAFVQGYIYGFLDSANLNNAIVLAPQFGMLWRSSSMGFINTGTFVFDWRRPAPDWSDNLLILHDVRGVLGPLRQRFADRSFFRLHPTQEAPYFQLAPISASEMD